MWLAHSAGRVMYACMAEPWEGLRQRALGDEIVVEPGEGSGSVSGVL